MHQRPSPVDRVVVALFILLGLMLVLVASLAWRTS